jgi:nitrogen fixation/metabolism regulation signal transduction histidine kinase
VNPRRTRAALAIGLVGFTSLATLTLMGLATQANERFGPLYSALLVLNGIGLTTLLVLITRNLLALRRQLRQGEPGSRLSLRMVRLFSVLSILPVLVVYAFSTALLTRGIDSWFDVDTETALGSALELSRTALDLRMREVLRQTERVAADLGDSAEPIIAIDLSQIRSTTTRVVNTPDPSLELDLFRRETNAEELLLVAANGRIEAFSSATSSLVPNTPSEAQLLQARQGRGSVSLDPLGDRGELYIRALVPVPNGANAQERLVLQALHAVPSRLDRLADDVQAAFARNAELTFLRDQLKLSFSMTLTLVLLFSVFAAIWAALYSARQIAEPVRDLAEGTRAVAAGDYSTTLPVATRDEIGFLVESFNEMTRRLAGARDEARRSRAAVDQERAYLKVLLGRLSSGVVGLDTQGRIRTANASAAQILGVPLPQLEGAEVADVAASHPRLGDFLRQLNPDHTQSEWQEEIELFGSAGRQVLMLRGAVLGEPREQAQGTVVVFDDITLLIQSQRNAAWGEVARRLAHEIKNPLTPIQLSAERLRHKYLKAMPEADAATFDRLTQTIVAQVETMKTMVNAFSDYARAPRLQPQPLDLRRLAEEVLELFRASRPEARITLDAPEGSLCVHADPGRLRQVFNNLLKNALEAAATESPEVRLRISEGHDEGATTWEVVVEDNGAGVPGDLLTNLFEPYVTTKHKGTGLGLAIVKKAIEEHGGQVWVENRESGGARFAFRLPMSRPAEAQTPADQRSPLSA